MEAKNCAPPKLGNSLWSAAKITPGKGFSPGENSRLTWLDKRRKVRLFRFDCIIKLAVSGNRGRPLKQPGK